MFCGDLIPHFLSDSWTLMKRDSNKHRHVKRGHACQKRSCMSNGAIHVKNVHVCQKPSCMSNRVMPFEYFHPSQNDSSMTRGSSRSRVVMLFRNIWICTEKVLRSSIRPENYDPLESWSEMFAKECNAWQEKCHILLSLCLPRKFRDFAILDMSVCFLNLKKGFTR